jgi:hypothetical protein
MTDWKEFIRSIAEEAGETVRFFDPATEAELQHVKNVLGVSVPEPLAELLRQTNGLSGEILVLLYLIGSCERIIEINREHAEWPKRGIIPPGEYFLFSEDGFGNSFGYVVENGLVSSTEIGVYGPMENEYRFASRNLKEWLREIISNTLRY